MKVGFVVVQESAIIHCFCRFRVRAFAVRAKALAARRLPHLPARILQPACFRTERNESGCLMNETGCRKRTSREPFDRSDLWRDASFPSLRSLPECNNLPAGSCAVCASRVEA